MKVGACAKFEFNLGLPSHSLAFEIFTGVRDHAVFDGLLSHHLNGSFAKRTTDRCNPSFDAGIQGINFLGYGLSVRGGGCDEINQVSDHGFDLG